MNPCQSLRLGDFDIAVSNQHQIFAGQKFNKEKLKLLPIGSLNIVPTDKIGKSRCVIQCNELVAKAFVVQPWKCDFTKKSGIFNPFWMVKEAEKAEDACLALQKLKVGNLHIPVYVNTKQIEKGTPLLAEPLPEETSKKQKKKHK